MKLFLLQQYAAFSFSLVGLLCQSYYSSLGLSAEVIFWNLNLWLLGNSNGNSAAALC